MQYIDTEHAYISNSIKVQTLDKQTYLKRRTQGPDVK